MAFMIIWFIVCIAQLALLFKWLRNVPTWGSRGPFIFLTILQISLAVGFITSAIHFRIVAAFPVTDDMSTNDVFFASNFFYEINLSFLPAIPLYLLHLRGSVLSTEQGKTFNPLMSQLWKRILDWVLVGVTYILLLSEFCLLVHDTTILFNDLDYVAWSSRQQTRLTFYHIVEAVTLLAYLNVIISSTVMASQLKNHKLIDLVRPLFLPLLSTVAHHLRRL
jgi:hypothetical protein